MWYVLTGFQMGPRFCYIQKMKFRLRYFPLIICFAAFVLLNSVYLVAQNLTNSVQFSVHGGFFKDSIQVVLGPNNTDLEILYTLDGSEPKIEYLNGKSYQYKNSYAQFVGTVPGELLSKSFRTFIYDRGIIVKDRSNDPDKLTQIATSFQYLPQYFPNHPVLKGTVLRARYYNPMTNEHGPLTTHTYFVSSEYFWDWKLPVISLSIQEDDLFDYENGIYVGGKILDDYIFSNPGVLINGFTDANYKRKGDEWEKPANFEYFESPNESSLLNHQIDIRVHGGFSRSYPVKSLRLYAKNKYGVSHFEHAFFNELGHERFKRLLLRNSGNDYNFVMFRDGLIHELVRDLNVETQAFQPTIVFINGEYWGIHNLRERIDDYYLERHFGVERDGIDYLTLNNEVEEGSNEHYLAMMEFIRSNDMTLGLNYDHVQTMMDVDNFIDYLIIQIFIGNSDWPANNIDYWREQVSFAPDLPRGRDGRWRWILYDTDFGFGLFNELPNRNSLFYAAQPTNPSHNNPLWSTELYRLLNTNPTFRDQFSNRFMDLLNTTFLPEHIKSKADSIQALIEPHIAMHIDRWKSPTELSKWQTELEYLHSYIQLRSNYTWLYLRSRYQLGPTYELTVNLPNVDEGQIQINSLTLQKRDELWSGNYSSRKPVTITAIPINDFDFSHWLEMPDSTNAKIIGIFEENITLTPVFKKNTSFNTAQISEIPSQTKLHQNYPNPFNPTSVISFSLQGQSRVKIEMFDLIGNRIQELVNDNYPPGIHNVTVNVSGLASGIYLYQMTSDFGIQTQKMTVLK